jgi:hypothetical protein
MSSYVFRLYVVLAFFTAAGNIGAVEIVSDRIVLPPEQREVLSPTGRFVLVLATADKWKTPRVSAELYRIRAAQRQLIWKRDLPHYHGPRRVLVSDRGEVLLVDEWINVVSRYALTIIDPENRIVASYKAEQVFTVLDVPLREITSRAKAGPWITDGPVFSPDGKFALITAGGRTLEVRLSDGRLTVRK